MMTRLGTLMTSVVVAALVSAVPDASAQVRGVLPGGSQAMSPLASALPGSVEGIVLDDAGVPVVGATVSALGSASALAVSDATGRFFMRGLPPGQYVVRAHFTGYIASRRQYVEVRASNRTIMAVSLRRAEHARVLAAGMAGGTDATQAADDNGEVAWRLRHLKRDPLKDTTDRYTVGDDDDGKTGFVRASSRFASALFDDLPFTGQVKLLTAGSFDGVDQLFSSDVLASGFASLSLAGRAGGLGDWAVQGVTSQGNAGSWFLAGTFRSHAPASHVYDVNVSYTAQHLPTTLAISEGPRAIGDNSRTVGVLSTGDRWQVSPQLAVAYGAQ